MSIFTSSLNDISIIEMLYPYKHSAKSASEPQSTPYRKEVLIFKDIFIDVIRDFGDVHEKEIERAARLYGMMLSANIIPAGLKVYGSFDLIRVFFKKYLIECGLLSDIDIKKIGAGREIKPGSSVSITASDIIMPADVDKSFFRGLFNGILNGLYMKRFVYRFTEEQQEYNIYTYDMTGEEIYISCKNLEMYRKLNYDSTVCEQPGFFKSKDIHNMKITHFRGKDLCKFENTLFHLISNMLPLDKVAHTAYDHFREMIDMDSTPAQLMNLLKNLLSSMGWGSINIMIEDDRYVFKIENPPYGLQLEADNWSFLSEMILGYLWLIDNNFRLSEQRGCYKRLDIVYEVEE